MRLCELAAEITRQLQDIAPGCRLLVLDYIRSGYSEDGQPIEHAPYQADMLRCIDCERPRGECAGCLEVSEYRPELTEH